MVGTWPLAIKYNGPWPCFLGKLFDWFEKIKGKQLLSVVTPASSIVFFQDSDPSLSIEPRGHGIYPWSPDAHRDVPKVPRAVCFFGQLLLLSMQSPVKDGFRLEAWEGLFPDHSQTTCVVLSFRCSTPRGLILPFVTAVFCLMGCVCVSLNVWCFTFRSIEVLGHLLKQIREQRSLAFFLCELAHVREQHVQQ